MNRIRCWCWLPALTFFALPLMGQEELSLGNSEGALGGVATVSLSLSNPGTDVEGLVATFEWDSAVGVGEALNDGPAISGANVVSRRVEAGYMALGVVMDSDGAGGEVIPAGMNQLLANAEIRCTALGTTAVTFVDGKYALEGDDPLLDNIIVAGGLSIGATDGLALSNGSFECKAGVVEMKLGNGLGTFGGVASVPLTLNSPDSVSQGLVAVFEWSDVDGTGVDLTSGAAIAGANVVQMRVEAGFAALGVVMDNDGVGGEVIEAGTDLDVATAGIRCMGIGGIFPVSFVDGAHALTAEGPALDNIVVQAGLSLGVTEGLGLTDGTFECNPEMADLELRLGNGQGNVGGNADVSLSLDNPVSEIQGVVAAFEWDPAAGVGVSLENGPALAEADTVSKRVEASYMVIGVVMDSDGAGGEVIPAGSDQLIATALIRCDSEGEFGVAFVDGKYALVGETPLLDNIVVEGGLSIGAPLLTLTDGSITCLGGIDEAFALKLGVATEVVAGAAAAVPLTLDAVGADAQGLVAAFEWDAAGGGADSITPGAAIANADIVSMRVDPGANFMVLGVVMDSDGEGGESIPAGTDIDIATANIICADIDGTFAVDFVDGKYAMTADGPALDNIVVSAGLSIGVPDGLSLVSGSFSCRSQPPTGDAYSLTVVSGESDPNADSCGDVAVTLSNTQPVEAFVVALCHDGGELTLNSITLGAAAVAAGADFEQAEILDGGGTLGVVLDIFSPFDGNVIEIGEGQEVAVFSYCCNNPPAFDQPATTSDLTLCDGVLGAPTKDNVVVVGGLSIGVGDAPAPLELVNGTFTCNPSLQPTDEICDNGLDDDGDGLIDCKDPDCFDDVIACPEPALQRFACGDCGDLDEDGTPGDLDASIGSMFNVCFFVQSPEDNAAGHAQFDHIQGLSMALTFCCDLNAADELDITGTIVEAIGADFVTVQADNDPDDGDGCELIIGISVDIFPPIEGITIPPLPDFQKIGSVKFTVSEDVVCDSICDIAFTDGVNGTGVVPVKNLISVENQALPPDTVDCPVHIVNRPTFFRGDCNFSGEELGMAINIADASAAVSFLFLPGTWKFEPPCLDACDCNDDGRIDLADVICILQYTLQSDDFPTFPPAPGTGLEIADDGSQVFTDPGQDPTEDKLDCMFGVDCP